MFEEISLPVLVMIFAVAAIVVYVAGVYVSNMTDVLSVRLGLGQALSGVILLAIVTNLPEFVITISAALTNNLGISIGNILGGIAIQTVVLVLFDAFGVGRSGRTNVLDIVDSVSLGGQRRSCGAVCDCDG